MAYIVETEELTKRFRKVKRSRGGGSLEAWVRGFKELMLYAKAQEYITAVDHVSLKIKNGEIFGLLGPNGAGKTTFLKLLSALYYPDEGVAYVNGYDTKKNPDKVKSSVTLAVGGFYLGFDYSLSVEKNLELYAALYGVPHALRKKRVDEAIATLELEEHRHRSPMHLSSGNRQRMIIARALLVRTPLVFLDEPTIHLDPKIAHDLRLFIKEVLNKQLEQTIILTTHYMEEAEMLSDHIGVLNQGRLLACDTPDGLKRQIGGKEGYEITTSKKVKKVDILAKELSWEKYQGKWKLKITFDGGDLGSVLDALRSSKAHVLDIKRIEPSLRNVIINLVEKDAHEH